MNINRDYLIINDVKKSNIRLDNGSMFFYITDKNTQNIFVNLVINISNNDLIQKYANIENAEDYTLTMNIVKPDNTYKIIEGKLHDKEKAIFEFNLNEDCCDEIGTYRCELLTKCNINDHEEITTSNKLTYKVKSSVLNDLDEIQEAPEYPLVIQLFDKLSDIEQYEEDRRANEVARQLAEEQRQTRFNTLDADMVDGITTMDNKMADIENRISAKEQTVDKLVTDTKADIDEYKVAKDQEIDDYKTAKDTEINNTITTQDNKINEFINERNDRLDALENKDALHNSRLDAIEAKDTEQDSRLDITENRLANIGNDITNTMQPIIDEHTSRLDAIEAIDVAQNNRLDAIEVKNQQQDDRLLDIEKVNKRQDIDLKCLFTEAKNNMMDITEEGNSIYLQNSTEGHVFIDEIKGNTLVNCNKEPDKELILNGNINTQGYSNVTLTEGVDGGLVDVALEGNTMVNVCDQKDPVAITKSYTVETGNHVALQGEYDGKCRPVVTGNTLWINNDTEEVLTAFDDTKNLRLQSSFEDNLVTQEMVDSGEEVADNLGKYKVEYKVTGKNKANANNVSLTPWSGEKINHKICDLKLQKGKQYTFTAVALSTSENTGRANIQYYKDGQEKSMQIFIINSTNPNSITFIYEGDSENCYLSCYDDDSRKINVQIEEGDTATSYEPYKEHTKTLYLNSPLLEGDTIEEKDGGIYHVHRSELVAYETDDELTLPTDMTNTLVAKASPTYEIISQNDTILCDSYVNGHLDVDSVVPIEKVDFLPTQLSPLKYVYEKTKYTLQFESDNVGKIDYLMIGQQTETNIDVIKGLNKINITTVSTSPYIDFRGIGFNASNIVVTEATDQDFGYFEGMKSVGECEDLEVVSSNSDGTLSNTQRLTHEPLRAVGDIKDKYVLIDGKWYIERNCLEKTINELYNSARNKQLNQNDTCNDIRLFTDNLGIKGAKNPQLYSDFKYANRTGVLSEAVVITIPGTDTFIFHIPKDINSKDRFLEVYGNGKCLFQLATPQYEPIDYNPFEVYSDMTHISNNSTIPANMVIKNTGYNCLLKPSTTYTVSSNLGLNTVTTPSVLTEDCLRFYDTDTSTVTTMKNVTILEGDYTTGKPIPSHFSGIESAFEQEYDEAVGKYKVKVRVQNEDASKENYIEFYINEPLRGIGDIKDKVYVKNDKVVVERNCGQRAYQDGDFGTYLTDKVNTVYQLAEPTYEEIEYNDVKLFIESFKNSTLSYNSNVPVTSKLYYSYSVPIVDTVAQTANVTDQQDSMIIDLATQVAVMEMMLM